VDKEMTGTASASFSRSHTRQLRRLAENGSFDVKSLITAPPSFGEVIQEFQRVADRTVISGVVRSEEECHGVREEHE
jgi:hypothetical protein